MTVTVFAACNQKADNSEQKNETTATSDTTQTSIAPEQEVVYTCSMHPEVIGKKGDRCPKCEMDLVPKE